MIRDLSDGTVRRSTSLDETRSKLGSTSEKDITSNSLLASTTSGLPITKAEYLERLEESRKWLKSYVAGACIAAR